MELRYGNLRTQIEKQTCFTIMMMVLTKLVMFIITLSIISHVSFTNEYNNNLHPTFKLFRESSHVSIDSHAAHFLVNTIASLEFWLSIILAIKQGFRRFLVSLSDTRRNRKQVEYYRPSVSEKVL